ncbi:uncharacterized protein LOC129220903 [Uloborus diversus]|uniref:uncharacterized protein LOC129220903 n=1 Tax=Uloborus diversus TaxID=327109 RepID=UPI00240A63E4|nr:uncharacterized protein LOC129220903 [Uloborus diversus]
MVSNMIFFNLFVLISGINAKLYLGDLPLENPDLFGGDMLGVDRHDRSAIIGEHRLWPGGIVPYEIDPSQRFQSTFHGAAYYYKKDTCIRFIPRTNHTDYIRIFPGQGCYSHVGRTGGQQPVSLGPGCEWMGTVVHELAHALGFYHEQNRSDRDDYLNIYWENIKEGMEDQFFKLKPEENQLLSPFDYDSIMLYGEYTFSKEKGVLKTMSRKNSDKPLIDVVRKYSLSKDDIKRINILYKFAMTSRMYGLMVLSLFGAVSAVPRLDVNLGGIPMENPDLFGGDMLGVEVVDRNVIPQQHLRWTGKKVPYIIDSALAGYSSLIKQAMDDYHKNTCIQFVERTSEENYIRLFPGRGCFSNVGMIGGVQSLSLGQGCMFKGTIIHELGHAIGFFHEHNRSDRDDYITIYWKNIQHGMDTQFILMKPEENLLLDEFDYNSIMMYGSKAFSKDGRSKTMVAKQDGVKLYETFDKPGLSASDIRRVKKMYEC